MSQAVAARDPAVFSPKTMTALLLVGVFAFSAFVVLLAYAPDLRGRDDPAAHALSTSAVGFAGAVALLKAADIPVSVSRDPPWRARPAKSLLVLTPRIGNEVKQLAAFGSVRPTLIVLPKWQTLEDPEHPGWVIKAGPGPARGIAALLGGLAKGTTVTRGRGKAAHRLAGGGYLFSPRTSVALDPIDQLQTLKGGGWVPVLTDESGGVVLGALSNKPVFVLADPDLLNTQGLAGLDNARVALAMLREIRPEGGEVRFDITLHTGRADRSLLRAMLEPPVLGATLCAVAAAVLLGLLALSRFGPAAPEARALALGPKALVDNSAGLVAMARREHELAGAYAELTAAEAARAAGVDRSLSGEALMERLDDLARRRGAHASLADLSGEAARTAKAGRRADLLSVARRLYQWKREVTLDRR